jgi:hypothetical protein
MGNRHRSSKRWLRSGFAFVRIDMDTTWLLPEAKSRHQMRQGHVGAQQADNGHDDFEIDTHGQPPFDMR